MKESKLSGRDRWRTLLLPRGIRERLFLLITLILLPSLLLLGWIYYQRYELRRDAAMQTELEVAQGVAAIFAAHIQDVRRLNHAVGQSIHTFSPVPREKANRLLTRTAAEYRTVHSLSWVSPAGVVLASNDSQLIGKNFAARPYLQEIQAGKPWAIGNLTPDAVFSIAAGIRDDGGNLIGVVVAGIEPDTFDEINLHWQRPAGGAYSIFDREGVLVYRSLGSPVWADRVRWRESDRLLRQVLETGEPQAGAATLAVPGGKWVSARVPIADYGWVAGAGRPWDIALAPVRKSLVKDLFFAGLIASLAFLAAFLLARTISRPLRRLASDAQGMGAGKIILNTDPGAPVEVSFLRHTVIDMATAIIEQGEATRRSEARFRAIFNGISDAAVFTDTERRIRMVNPAFTAIFGYTAEEVLGRSTEFLYAATIDYKIQGEQRFNLKEESEISSFQLRYRRKDGSEFWSESLGVRIVGSDGTLIGFLALHRDVTQRKQAEEALRESEERLRLFIEYAPAALAMFDRHMRYITASRRWRHDFGLGDRELSGVSHYEVFPEVPEHWRQIHRRALAGEVLRAKEDRFERANGRTQWLRWEVRPWRDATGAVGGILIFSEEITERKRVEEALRESEERLRQGVQVAHIGIFEHDHRTDVIHLSPEMREFTEWGEEEPVTLPGIIARVHPDDRERMAAAVQLSHDPTGDGHYSVDCRFIHTDGNIRYVSVRARTFFIGEGAARRPLRTIGAAVDITERMRMEGDLLAAKEAAEEANRVKSEFLANISHELRTPLTVIMTVLEMLRDPSLGETEPAPFLAMADTSAQHLLGIIDDLLDITRIEAQQLRIAESAFDLPQAIRHALQPFAGQAREKGLRFNLEMAPHLPKEVLGDPVRLRQVIINLVGNAVKFTEKGEVTVTVAEEEGQVVLTVADTGIGIPAEKAGLLFHPFTQIDSSLTRRHGGTGLGLAISKELAEQMGGTIRAESSPAGSTFIFSLPLRPVAPDSPLLPSAAAGDRPVRILLAEDDPMIRNLIEMVLQRRGWQAKLAENGRQAVELWAEGGIDLILMDLQMPEMDGLAATRTIRARETTGTARTPILALTAHARPEDREECLAAGMDGFLSKPISMEELYGKTESCLYENCEAAREPD